MSVRYTIVIDDLDREGAPVTPWAAAIWRVGEGHRHIELGLDAGLGGTPLDALTDLVNGIEALGTPSSDDEPELNMLVRGTREDQDQ